MGKLPQKIAVVGDTHCGRESIPATVCSLKLVKQMQPDLVVHLGDAEDFEGLMRHRVGRVGSRNKDAASLVFQEETMVSRHYWLSLRAAAGKAPIVCLRSNHGIRYMSRLTEALPHMIDLISEYPSVVGMDAAGVEFIDLEYITCGNFVLTHGDRYGETGPKWAMMKDFGTSVMQGHNHRLEATPWRYKTGEIRWICSAGCTSLLQDWNDKERQHQHGMQGMFLTKHGYVPRPIHIQNGLAVIDSGVVEVTKADCAEYWRPIRKALNHHSAEVYTGHHDKAMSTSVSRASARQLKKYYD
jgi:hypothetical protein